jgi:hypothetical protein
MYALVLFNLDPAATATEDKRNDTINRIRSAGLPNAKQLILQTDWLPKDEVLVEILGGGPTTDEVLRALAPFVEIPGVKSFTVLHIVPSPSF